MENAEKLTKSALTELQKIIDNRPEQKDLDKYKEGEYNDDKTNLKDNMYWMNALTKTSMMAVINMKFLTTRKSKSTDDKRSSECG